MGQQDLEALCSFPHTFVLTGGTRHRGFLRYVVEPNTRARAYYLVEPRNLEAFETLQSAAVRPANVEERSTWGTLATPVEPENIAVVNRY